MNRYGRGGSKASSTTLCQKCLKRGHYSYECKAQAQERPYQSRPSRTQQLLNPRLKPKLTNTAPEDILPKKSLTDQLLDKNETSATRRKRSLDDMDESRTPRKRSRSISSYSSTSVSTISTRSSRSPAAPHPSRETNHNHHTQPERSLGHEKRMRRDRSSSSNERKSPEEQAHAGAGNERRTRLRRRSTSPAERGRRRSRSTASEQRQRFSESRYSTDHRAVDRRRPDFEREEQALPRNESGGNNDRTMKDAQAIDQKSPHRQRSLSPYSKRVARNLP